LTIARINAKFLDVLTFPAVILPARQLGSQDEIHEKDSVEHDLDAVTAPTVDTPQEVFHDPPA
jgi:hypothetical protein